MMMLRYGRPSVDDDLLIEADTLEKAARFLERRWCNEASNPTSDIARLAKDLRYRARVLRYWFEKLNNRLEMGNDG